MYTWALIRFLNRLTIEGTQLVRFNECMRRTETSNWTLQVSSGDGVEEATFASREDAVEHGVAIIQDYDNCVNVTIVGPDGTAEPIEHLAHTGTEMNGVNP
jgi:hypothetical protein